MKNQIFTFEKGGYYLWIITKNFLNIINFLTRNSKTHDIFGEFAIDNLLQVLKK